ncbi:MAG: hypothetical protein AVDCRST_MAG96-3396, partial [uncultured Segetibacter sp.]
GGVFPSNGSINKASYTRRSTKNSYSTWNESSWATLKFV